MLATTSPIARLPLRRISSRPAAPAPAQLPQKASPFLKWVGGKGRLLSQLVPLLPAGVAERRHVEPFVGGGAFFFHQAPGRALLSDVNPALVTTYVAIRDDVEGVIAALESLAAEHSKVAYYGVRERYNTHPKQRTPAEHAAMFIYLNKTCFNGLHRVNRRGEFNVPAGEYKNPRILDEACLRAASAALRGADIRCQGFEALIRDARPGDFVYFDPPYVPVSDTASFTSYAKDGFDDDDQVRLRDVFRELDRRGAKLMLSNSDVPRLHELYAGYKIDLVAAARAINCDATKRGAVTEVVIRNY